MRWWAGIVALMPWAGIEAAMAQPFPAADTLTPQQVRGRNLFNQSCMVCHVKLQITSPAKYGPDLSRNSLSGQEARRHQQWHAEHAGLQVSFRA
jgi:mono/diheme cytochrome c family protein